MKSKFNLKYIFLLLLILIIIIIYLYIYIKNKTNNSQILSYPGCTATIKEISDCSDKFRNSGSSCGKNCKYCENTITGGEDCIPESCNCN